MSHRTEENEGTVNTGPFSHVRQAQAKEAGKIHGVTHRREREQRKGDQYEEGDGDTQRESDT
jgi:hypothetical protein